MFQKYFKVRRKLGYLKFRYSKFGLKFWKKNFRKKFRKKILEKNFRKKKFSSSKSKSKVKGQPETGRSTGSLCLFYCDVINLPRCDPYTTAELCFRAEFKIELYCLRNQLRNDNGNTHWNIYVET